MRIVVPDQRYAPLIAGEIRIHAGLGFDGIRPSGTIGSEKMTRISLASCNRGTSPVGPVLTMVSGADWLEAIVDAAPATTKQTTTPRTTERIDSPVTPHRR